MMDKVSTHKQTIEDFYTDHKEFKCDIIISEWMGYFLIYERMIDSIIFSRDKFLRADGYMLPDKAVMKVQAYSNYRDYKAYFDFWENIWGTGIKMPVCKKYQMKEAIDATVWKVDCVGRAATLKEFDMYTVKVADLDFRSDFRL